MNKLSRGYLLICLVGSVGYTHGQNVVSIDSRANLTSPQGQNVLTTGTLIGATTTNITTAVPFLSITPDSRAAGIGDAGAATAPDVNSAYWNAGKLAFIDKGLGASLSYTPWLGKIINDMKLVHLSGFYKINREQAVAASLKYFDLGNIELRDGANVSQGRFNPREVAFDVTYSRLLTEHFSIGGSLRYIYSNLVGSFANSNSTSANSVAVDIGFFYTKPIKSKNATLSLGASISNIGAKISYTDPNNSDFIPTNLRLGGAYKTELDGFNSLTFILDFNKLMVPSPALGSRSKPLLDGIFGSFSDASGGFSEELSEFTISGGLEYWYRDIFAGRLGYFYEDQNKGNRKYLTVGIGAKYNDFGLDVAYLIPTNGRESALAETIRFTLAYTFPAKVKNEESVTD
jgi:Type IX secretion system protein PorV